MARARKATFRLLTGDKEIDRRLARIQKTGTANKIARSALSASANVYARAMRKEVPSKDKDVKKAIGSSVKVKGKFVTAKAGAAVGRKAGSDPKDRDSKRPGVGIAAANIHWYILGTKKRKTKSGKSTGRMPEMSAIQRGAKKASAAAQTKLTDQAKKVYAKEMLKVLRSNG